MILKHVLKTHPGYKLTYAGAGAGIDPARYIDHTYGGILDCERTDSQ